MRVELLEGHSPNPTPIPQLTQLDGPHQSIVYPAPELASLAYVLRDLLVLTGYVGPKSGPRDIELRKDGGIVVVAFALDEGTWDNPETVTALGKVQKGLSDPRIARVRVDLCNGDLDVKKSLGP